MKALGFLLLAALIPSGMFGRIGENEPELVARYGAVTSRQPARKSINGKMEIHGLRLGFRYEFWTISAVVSGGRCEEINYVLEGRWTDAHFNRLLEINGGRNAWSEQKTRNEDNHRSWIRADQATAHWGLTGFMVRLPPPAAAR